tara:strand:- start:10422 stop:12155 length:1734 start_codon:yes stop_codon:yes gene_type:complete
MIFFKQFYNLLNGKQKKFFIALIFFSILIVFLELLSIGLVIPLISLILEPDKFISNFGLKESVLFIYAQEVMISKNFIFYFLFFFILIFILKNFLIFLNHYLQYKFVENIEVSFSRSIFFKYLSQKYPFFFSNKNSSLITKLSVDFHNFTLGFVGQIITLTSEFFIVIGFIALVIYLKLFNVGIVFLIFFSVGAILMKFIGSLSKKWGNQRSYFDHLKINLLNNSFQNIKSIIIDNKRESITKNFNRYVKQLAAINRKIFTAKAVPRSIFEIFGIISLSSAIIFMTIYDYDKNYVITTTGFFIAVAYRIVPSFQKIIYCYQTISFGRVVLNSIEKDIALNNDLSNSEEKIVFNKSIELKNLYFKYPGRDKIVLKNLDLKIDKGKSVGIYGDSGGGKSTLVDVMSCLIPSEKGKIKIDDITLDNDLLIRKWQNQISYVTQNTILFDDSIKNNITFSSNKDLIDENYLSEIIKNTQLSEFIKNLPNKLDTHVGEMGSQLSGGQRKRIGIARALYKKPELIIFDEATSELDKETEEKILSLIFNLKKQMTMIFISHDLDVLKKTNEIYKLSDGKLIKINE